MSWTSICQNFLSSTSNVYFDSFLRNGLKSVAYSQRTSTEQRGEKRNKNRTWNHRLRMFTISVERHHRRIKQFNSAEEDRTDSISNLENEGVYMILSKCGQCYLRQIGRWVEIRLKKAPMRRIDMESCEGSSRETKLSGRTYSTYLLTFENLAY